MSKRRLVQVLFSVSGVLSVLLIVVVAAIGYLSVLSSRLPDLKANPEALKTAETSVVYAADGSVLAEWFDEEDRIVISNEEIPHALKQAAVAIEDRRFYEHDGVDVQAIARALRVNSNAGEVRQGGSTITQQTVKMLLTDGRRTVTRKIEEALLALQLETRAEKDDVIGVYLNTVYFGRGAYGAESAARRFFGTSAKGMTLEQCALLAGCIQSPTRFDPFINQVAALERRNVVLKEMSDQGYITRQQFAVASAEPLGLKPPQETKAQVAPYFVEYVRRDLVQRLGSERLYRGGLRIHTTLDPSAQRAAEEAASRILPSPKDPEVALVSVRWSDGAVVALVGGRDFDRSQFDLATQGKRQTGSAFKPFVLAAALEQGYSLDSKFEGTPFSTPVRDGIWHVDNYEGQVKSGSYTLRLATIWSINTVYARLVMRVGADKVVDVAHRMGIETPIDPEPAIALGGLNRGVSPLEMASAFGTIANGGVHVKPSGVARVLDADGEVVYEPDRAGKRAISKAVASKLSGVLNEVYSTGTGTEANFGRWGAIKTGTAQSWRDAWTVGWSGDLSTAVWIGYPQSQVAMTNVHGIRVTGGSLPAHIWKGYMKTASTGRAPAVAAASNTADAAPTTSDLKIYTLCNESLKIAGPNCPQTIELAFRAGFKSDTCTLDH